MDPTLVWAAISSISTFCLACLTGLLAIATVVLALESRQARIKNARTAKEIAFRAALTELADNITTLERWNPTLASPATAEWRSRHLGLEALRSLFSAVWIEPRLWDRIQSVAFNLESGDIWLKAELIDKNPEHAKNIYFMLDIYLKQLARYLAVEMQRQHLGAHEVERVTNSKIFRPLPWAYGSPDETPEFAAARLESQLVPPFANPAPEPEDPILRTCRLAVLIQEARVEAKDRLEQLRARQAI